MYFLLARRGPKCTWGETYPLPFLSAANYVGHETVFVECISANILQTIYNLALLERNFSERGWVPSRFSRYACHTLIIQFFASQLPSNVKYGEVFVDYNVFNMSLIPRGKRGSIEGVVSYSILTSSTYLKREERLFVQVYHVHCSNRAEYSQKPLRDLDCYEMEYSK